MKIFKVMTAAFLTLGLTIDIITGYPLNMIYVLALIAVLFT